MPEHRSDALAPLARVAVCATFVLLAACNIETAPPDVIVPRAGIGITGPAQLAPGDVATLKIVIHTGDRSPYVGKFWIDISGVYSAVHIVPVSTAEVGLSSGEDSITIPSDAQDGVLMVVANAMDRSAVAPDTIRIQVRRF